MSRHVAFIEREPFPWERATDGIRIVAAERVFGRCEIGTFCQIGHGDHYYGCCRPRSCHHAQPAKGLTGPIRRECCYPIITKQYSNQQLEIRLGERAISEPPQCMAAYMFEHHLVDDPFV
jgi:hypothetical protein